MCLKGNVVFLKDDVIQKLYSNKLSKEGKAEAINTTWAKAAEKLVELYNQMQK